MHMHWSWRSSTKAAQKLPNDHQQQIRDALGRLAILCRTEEIPKERVFLADETFCYIRPVSRFTWNLKNDKSVPVFGKEEKGGFTVMLGSTLAGNLLPIQILVEGKLHRALQKFLADLQEAWEEATSDEDVPYAMHREGGHMLAATGQKHWTTVETLKAWIRCVVWPAHVNSCRTRSEDPETCASIVHIDAYPVHKDSSFREWMSTRYS